MRMVVFVIMSMIMHHMAVGGVLVIMMMRV